MKKIFIFESISLKSNTNDKQSLRFLKIMNKLSQYNPVKLEMEEISSDYFKNKWLIENDNNNTVIIAHYSDVEKYFSELEKIEKAIILFHTYNSEWLRSKINHNDDVLRISNTLNRFCCDSESVTNKIGDFIKKIMEGVNAFKAFDVLKGFNPELEMLLEPFKMASPIVDSQWKSKLILAKKKLNEYLQNNK